MHGEAAFVVYQRSSSTDKTKNTHGVVKLVKEGGKWKHTLIGPEDQPQSKPLLDKYEKSAP